VNGGGAGKWLGILPVFCLVGVFLVGFTGCSRGIDKRVMVNKVQKIAKLGTCEFKLRKILFAKKEKKFTVFSLGTATYMAWVEPKVVAGIDVDRIGPRDIDIDDVNKTIYVQLPPVEIISYDFNEEGIEVDQNLTTGKLFNKISLEDLEKILRDADKDIRAYLNFLDIREETKKSTRKYFAKYFESLGYKGIVSFKDNGKPLVFFDMSREMLDAEGGEG
jgi:hypothetical protein